MRSSGESEAELDARLERIEGSLRRGNMGYAFVKMTSSEEQANVWEVRRAGIGLMMGVSGDANQSPSSRTARSQPRSCRSTSAASTR